MPETKVKEEVDEPELPSDPVEVPPGVVLDKLEALVTSGKVLLRFQRPGAKGWGINGRVSQWCSFKVDAEGACQFVDDTVWTTDGASEWAESELEWLEKLRQQALKTPATPAEQPNALRPRLCRRAAFAYHKAEWVKQRQAKAKAKALAKSQSQDEGGAGQAAPPAAAKPVVSKAAAPPAKAVVSKAPAAPMVQPAVQPADPAKAKLPSIPKSPAPAVKVAGAAAAKAGGAFPAFLGAVKARLTEAGQRDKYRQFLAAVSKGAQEQAILESLAGHDDLIEQFRRIPKPGAALGDAKQPPAAAGPQVGAGVSEPPEQPALPRTKLAPVNVEKEVLAPLRECGGNAALQLVKLALQKRGARASLRLAMLKYARSQSMEEGAFREMIILRGPPGMGKSTWAMEQLRLQVGLVEDEELVARLTHICSADDFLTKFVADDQEEFVPDLVGLEMAYGCNEARARLAMEAGIHPIYIDNSHTQLWEMAPYVRLAQSAGYEVSIVSPMDIFDEWKDAEALQERSSGRPESRAVPRGQLEALIKAFEALPPTGDPLPAILQAQRPAAAAAAAKGFAAAAKGPVAAKGPAAAKGSALAAAAATQGPTGFGAKRPAPPATAPPLAKVAKGPQPPPRSPLASVVAKRPAPPQGASAAKAGAAVGEAAGAAGVSAEAKVTASLLAGLRKKAADFGPPRAAPARWGWGAR
eukprot:CAMPEP_0179177162 /NCGR_PEP_ID=MMETSP0796-20121207/87610_1 /TAXON_ID=73915 /ORGANISM="Pyrodinium bahamense, Strain pbaha01" /LENGTH=695 /DNA_ID=CAMNT_0020880709 /DNA_START=1 /DNA_END=2087 /DNA_ORIENTATION=+